MDEFQPRSPCVSICALDEQGFCIGCLRSSEEIAAWPELSRQQKMEVLRRIDERVDAMANGILAHQSS